jgi:hypothetical protein
MGGMVGWLAGTATDAGTSTDATTTSRSGTAASDTPTTTTQPTTDEGFGRSGAVPGGSTDGWSGGAASSTGPSTATHGS